METSNLMKEVLKRDNLNQAFKEVVRNKGAAGVDGMEYWELGDYLKEHGEEVKEQMRTRRYKPSPVLRVEIPKPEGGVRKLGIPTVRDRFVQQAVAQVLMPVFEEQFHGHSYGFRPNRCAQQAIIKALEMMNDDNTWIVDIDLEKFFDTVHHDKLMTQVGKSIEDGDIISIVRKFLVSGVMVDDEYEESVVGTPQGGNISPLLSNIMLNELDKELDKRRLSFMRYADDCIIMMGSEMAADRVMRSIKKFIEEKLWLKVNMAKSKVARPEEVKYLGLGFFYDHQAKQYKAKPHTKSVAKFKQRMKELTRRSWGVSNSYKVMKLNQLIRGWVNYFRIGKMKRLCKELDQHIRFRVRMCIWKFWKSPRNRAKCLLALGAPREKAWAVAYSGHRIAFVCHGTTINFAITNKILREKLGLVSMLDYYVKC